VPAPGVFVVTGEDDPPTNAGTGEGANPAGGCEPRPEQIIFPWATLWHSGAVTFLLKLLLAFGTGFVMMALL
jgi:hypothetical protein